MPWYVIQTYTGEEEKLVEMIHRIVPEGYYGECFLPYYEQLRRRAGANQIHVLRLFPGYIFISSNDIEQLFRYLKKVPAMTKIMAADEFSFTPLGEGEAEFLLDMMDADHIVRLTYAATDGRDHVTYLSGPLEKCRTRICSWRFRKRYAVVRLQLEGHEKEVKLGIILNDDVRREIAYGKVEAAVELPEKYSVWREEPVADAGAAEKMPGDEGAREDIEVRNNTESRRNAENRKNTENRVLVVEGPFEGSMASVSQVKKDVLRITVQMFGREIRAEVPAESVRRIESN